MKTSDWILDILGRAGVTELFGIPGDAINDLIDAVRRQDRVRFIHVAHEESGALAASAQAKVTGRLAACVGTAGPGAIHLLNGLYDAKHDGAPVLAITGQVERRFLNSDCHQEIDSIALFRDVAVFNATIVSAEQAPELVVRAVRAAVAKGGVAHLAVPADVMQETVTPAEAPASLAVPSAVLSPDPDLVEEAARLIQQAERPLFLIGAGCRDATDDLVELASRIHAPIVRSLRAKDVLPDTHPLSLGGHGLLGTRPASEAIDSCDLLMVVGSDFPYVDFYPEDTKTIQIDIDPERIGGRKAVSVGLVADARQALRAILDKVAPRDDSQVLQRHQEAMERWTRKRAQEEQDGSMPLRPQRVARAVGEQASPGALYACDTGAVTVWAARHLPMRPGDRFTMSSGLGTMGFAVPAAIGLQLAFPDKPVVALVGDGSMQVLLGELLTAVRYELPLVIVVFNNGKLGLIQMEQEAAGIPETLTGLPDLDFAAFAELAGARGLRVSSPDELAPALQDAFASTRPFVLDVRVNPDELTMPPKIELQQALGFLRAKAKELLGKGDAEGGVTTVKRALGISSRRD